MLCSEPSLKIEFAEDTVKRGHEFYSESAFFLVTVRILRLYSLSPLDPCLPHCESHQRSLFVITLANVHQF